MVTFISLVGFTPQKSKEFESRKEDCSPPKLCTLNLISCLLIGSHPFDEHENDDDRTLNLPYSVYQLIWVRDVYEHCSAVGICR